MNIEEGKTYTPAEWREVQTQLLPGDEYEAVNRVEVKKGGNLVSGFHKVTVTKLVPREPDWAGAYLVQDRDSDLWIHEGEKYRAVTCRAVPSIKALELEEEFGPIIVILDADRRIPIDSLMKVNHVSRDGLFLASVKAVGPGNVMSTDHHKIIGGILGMLS